MIKSRTRFGLSIRVKALLLLPLVLAIPYVGYQYVREMENFLRAGLEEGLVATARALASGLRDQPGLLAPVEAGLNAGTGIYAHPLPAPIEIDGYTGDWGHHLSGLRSAASTGNEAEARYVAGTHGGYLYLLLQVKDDHLVYRDPRTPLARRSDQVRLVLRSSSERERAFVLSPISPGRVSVFQIPERNDTSPIKIEIRILAAWQTNPDGYALEIRFPLAMTGERIGFDVLDFDPGDTPDKSRKLNLPHPGPLILPSDEIQSLIGRLGHLPGRRVWVLDGSRRVLARGGSLEREEPVSPINPLYGLLLLPPSDEVFQEPPMVSHLTGVEIDAALGGAAEARWRATAEDNVWVVSVAFPVTSGDEIAGVVVIEESSLGIQTVTREALANLFNKTLVVSLAGALVLVLFASRIGTRLGRLRDEAESAIDSHGRVTGGLSPHHGNDEIGQMSQSFAAMMERLRQYNQYLENLARRLSHELRTPLAIVRSSLDSLALDPNRETAELYGARAREGIVRLDAILTRMSEAARLEQSIQAADRHVFDLNQLVLATGDAYRATWPDHEFVIDGLDQPANVMGVEDLVVQMMDKLIINAVELGDASQSIGVRLRRTGEHYVLSVTNRGSSLPQAMQGKLFESMVSIREGAEPVTPHLGLGLYIARLVADFHGAVITATNLESSRGVEIKVSFPSLI